MKKKNFHQIFHSTYLILLFHALPAPHSCHRIDINIYAKSISSAISHINTYVGSMNADWIQLIAQQKGIHHRHPHNNWKAAQGVNFAYQCMEIIQKNAFVKAAFALILKSNKRKEWRKYGNAVRGEDFYVVLWDFNVIWWCFRDIHWTKNVCQGKLFLTYLKKNNLIYKIIFYEKFLINFKGRINQPFTIFLLNLSK